MTKRRDQLRIADCGLRIADCGMRIADCGLGVEGEDRFCSEESQGAGRRTFRNPQFHHLFFHFDEQIDEFVGVGFYLIVVPLDRSLANTVD